MNTQSIENTPWTSRAALVIAPPRRQDLVVEEMEDEIVFTDPAEGQTFHLNPTAYRIWQRCDGRTAMREIARELTTSFDVNMDCALDDVEQIVAFLAETGLLATGDPA